MSRRVAAAIMLTEAKATRPAIGILGLGRSKSTIEHTTSNAHAR
jgi:hypothetical protein